MGMLRDMPKIDILFMGYLMTGVKLKVNQKQKKRNLPILKVLKDLLCYSFILKKEPEGPVIFLCCFYDKLY